MLNRVFWTLALLVGSLVAGLIWLRCVDRGRYQGTSPARPLERGGSVASTAAETLVTQDRTIVPSRSEPSDQDERPEEHGPSSVELLIVRGTVTTPFPGLVGAELYPVVMNGPCVGASLLDSDGRFEMSLPWEDVAFIDELEFRVTCRAARLSSQRLSLHGAVRTQRNGEPVRVLEVAHTLPPGCIVVGEVRDSDGSPVSGGDVGVFSVEATRPITDTLSNADGRFSLIVPPGSVQLVAVDADDLLEFSCQSLIVPDEPLLDLGVVDLGRGSSIDGTVVSRHLVDVKTTQFGLSARLQCRSQEFFWRGRLICWSDGELHMSFRSTTVKEDGTFSFSGLARRSYSLQWHAISGSCRLPEVELSSIDVIPPISDLIFDPSESFMLFRVTDDRGLPIRAADLRFACSDVSEMTCDSSNQGSLLVASRPECLYTITVSKSGYLDTRLEVVSPARGGMAFHDLRLKSILVGSLAVEVRGEEGDVLREAAFSLVPLDATNAGTLVEQSSARDTHLIADIPTGRYRLSVAPRGHLTGFEVPASIPVEVVAGETRSHRVQLPKGGRLEISVKDAEGRMLAATCRLETPDGSQLPIALISYDATGTRYFSSPSVAHPPGSDEDFARVEHALSPGRYRCHAELDGFSSASAIVEVRKRETTRLDLELIRE